MKCDVCGVGERRQELIRYHVEFDGKLVVVEHVPALVCDHCGEISVAPQVASSVQRTVWGGQTSDTSHRDAGLRVWRIGQLALTLS